MIEFGEFEEGKPRVIVVIPYRKGGNAEAFKAAKIHHVRAGMPCKVYAIEDSEQKGWVHMHNEAFKTLEFDYYVYSCDDYFPGRDYLVMTYRSMKKFNCKLVIFNDGKWVGSLATAAMVHKDLTTGFYHSLFHRGYKQNYADAEITDFAVHMGEAGYQPNAVLMEIDYCKESKPHLNLEDQELYRRRVVPWPKRFS